MILDKLQLYHVFGCKERLDKKLAKTDFETFKIFYATTHGSLAGLNLAKFSLPDDMVICWKCMKTLWATLSVASQC